MTFNRYPALFLFLFILFLVHPAFVCAAEKPGHDPDSLGYIVRVGDPCPYFELSLADGSKTTLAQLKGKLVLLQFTASWCSVCRREMPVIEEEIWQVYKEKGLILIGVDRDEPLEKVKLFSSEMKISYPLALDPGAEVFALFAGKQSGVTRNVLISPDGKIIFLTRLFERTEFDRMIEVIGKVLK